MRTLLCFFAKDRTPCCGRERKALCDKLRVLAQHGISVRGVTIDQVRDHAQFAAGCDVAYPMVQDRDYALCRQYGVLRERTYKGKTYNSVEPKAFLLDVNGNVEHEFANFDLEHQALLVLEGVAH